MADRLSMLVGAGVITAGVSAAMLAGAGVAVATTDPGAGANSVSTSEPSDPSTPAESVDTSTDPDQTAPDVEETDDADDSDVEEADDADDTDDTDDPDDEQDDVATPGEPSAVAGDTDDSDAVVVDVADVADVVVDQPVITDESVEAEPVVEESADVLPAATPGDAASTTGAPTSAPEPVIETGPTHAVEKLATLTAVDAASEAASTPARQTLLSVIGTVIFNIYSFAVRALGGPPLLPWGSTVTVRSSSVTIDCGEGYEVPADWYVPEGPTPTRLIYFQHGFLASGAFYSYTASRLAEATHSIVVATSLTSNFLSCEGCWVGGSPMHKAVADLFADGNTALAQSALAAGYSATLLDGIEKVALVGHSAGGGLAAGTAGYMTQNGTFDKLAGVVMLDGVGFGSVTPDALAKLPKDLPIYNLAGRSYYWNLSGTTNTSLEQWRPDGFNGLRLAGGSHSDTMLGGNPLIQAALNIVTGWSKVENVKAAEKISAGWLNDMFSGTAPSPASGLYGERGDTLEIETSRGTATAYVLPGPTERVTFLDWLFTEGGKLVFGIDFATCAVDSSGIGEIQEVAAPNTALSLDGRAKASQSIGQQCVHG